MGIMKGDTGSLDYSSYALRGSVNSGTFNRGFIGSYML